MGYYDFNDHFWEPHQVCAQRTVDKTPKKSWLERKFSGVRTFFTGINRNG